MQFAYIFAIFFTLASVVLAIPTGMTMRATCDLGACVTTLGPAVKSCAEAVGKKGGKLVTAGIACLTDAADAATNFPDDCTQCVKQFDIVGKAKAAGTAIKNAAESTVDEVEDLAGKAGDALGRVF